MLKVIDLVYYAHNDYDKPQQVLEKHAPALGFAPYIKDRVNIQFVKHLNYEGIEKIDGIRYGFFKSRNRFWYIPFKTHRYIKDQNPDIVIVEGLIFPLQLMMLKVQLGKKTKIIAQHHNEKPYPGLKGFLQKLADKSVSRYLFTSRTDAKEWVDRKIIRRIDKCNEVMEASTFITKQDKKPAQEKTGMDGSCNFLWVGRLDSVKDPFTVLKGFEKFAAANPGAMLFVIYQSGDQIEQVEKIVNENSTLKRSVKLIGKKDHTELGYWYSAADFYVTGSHREAGNYAIMEAMACGCIPVVTDIPSFRKMTADGKYGFLYPPGNANALTELLNNLKNINQEELSIKVQNHFTSKLGFKNIAEDLYQVFFSLTGS